MELCIITCKSVNDKSECSYVLLLAKVLMTGLTVVTLLLVKVLMTGLTVVTLLLVKVLMTDLTVAMYYYLKKC